MCFIFASFLVLSFVLATTALHARVGDYGEDTPLTRRSALEFPGMFPAAPGWHPRRHQRHASDGGVSDGGDVGASGRGVPSRSQRHPPSREVNEAVPSMKRGAAGDAAAENNTPEAALRRSQLRALTDDEVAKLKQLDPGAFAAVPPSVGADWDPKLKNPCWTDPTSGAKRCVPYYYVVGAWQSGGQSFNAKLAKHPQVRPGPGATHFWNEDRRMSEYVPKYDAFAEEVAIAEGRESVVVGDASPGNLANSWAESQRLHREFTEFVRKCWQACQMVSDRVPEDAPEGSPTARRMCIDGGASGGGGGGAGVGWVGVSWDWGCRGRELCGGGGGSCGLFRNALQCEFPPPHVNEYGRHFFFSLFSHGSLNSRLFSLAHGRAASVDRHVVPLTSTLICGGESHLFPAHV